MYVRLRHESLFLDTFSRLHEAIIATDMCLSGLLQLAKLIFQDGTAGEKHAQLKSKTTKSLMIQKP